MSYQIGRAALNLQWTPRVARTEYNDNWEIVRHFTGKDPRSHPDAAREFNDALHLDFLWSTNDGPVPWEDRGRVTDMGHARYLEDGSDFRPALPSPFQTAADVLRFDAVEEYGLPDFDDLVHYYEAWYGAEQAANDQVVPGGYYRTLISGAIAAFGWENLLAAAGTDADRFGEVLNRWAEVLMGYVRAWAATDIEAFITHDDIVWTAGGIFPPAFYRRWIAGRAAASLA